LSGAERIPGASTRGELVPKTTVDQAGLEALIRSAVLAKLGGAAPSPTADAIIATLLASAPGKDGSAQVSNSAWNRLADLANGYLPLLDRAAELKLPVQWRRSLEEGLATEHVREGVLPDIREALNLLPALAGASREAQAPGGAATWEALFPGLDLPPAGRLAVLRRCAQINPALRPEGHCLPPQQAQAGELLLPAKDQAGVERLWRFTLRPGAVLLLPGDALARAWSADAAAPPAPYELFAGAGSEQSVELPLRISRGDGEASFRLLLLRSPSGRVAARLCAETGGWSRALQVVVPAQEALAADLRADLAGEKDKELRKPEYPPGQAAGKDDEDAAEAGSAKETVNAVLARSRREMADPIIAAAGEARRRDDDPAYPSAITWTGDRIEGNLTVVLSPRELGWTPPQEPAPSEPGKGRGAKGPKGPQPAVASISVQLSLAGAKVDGDWSAAWNGTKTQGKASGGRIVDAAAAADTWPAEIAWPMHDGRPDENRRIGGKAAWLEDPRQARLVWMGRDAIGDGDAGNDLRYCGMPGAPVPGGYCSPVLADGTVLQAYYRPSGADFQYKRSTRGGVDSAHRYRLRADDCVLAVDAATGTTRWKAVLPSSGQNWHAMHKAGYGVTPACADGRVFTLGSSGLLSCFDIRSGALRWQNDIGPRARHIRSAMEQTSIPAGWTLAGNRDFLRPLLIADGLVIACDFRKWNDKYYANYTRDSGLRAYDAASGRLVWEQPGIIDGGPALAPLLWRHGGRNHLIIADDSGTRCLEAATGKQLWLDARIGSEACYANPAVAGDWLLADLLPEQRGLRVKGRERIPAGARLRPDGLDVLWSAPEGVRNSPMPKAIHDGRGYVIYATGSADGHWTGGLATFDMASGRLLGKTEYIDGLAGDHDNALALVGDGMFFTTNGRERPGMHVFALAQDGVRKLPEFHLPMAGGYANGIVPIIGDGRIIVRLEDRLACYDLRRGR
jgi:outer membrane protein assembly factor BamB